jgi:TPP-dependent pyruvate/acetoin dehydrogenase alpha subunit
LILNTERFGPHSKGDDTRSPELLARLRAERDPLVIHGSRLKTAERTEIEHDINRWIEAAYQQALQDPFPVLDLQEST